jgi:hypothetical protein
MEVLIKPPGIEKFHSQTFAIRSIRGIALHATQIELERLVVFDGMRDSFDAAFPGRCDKLSSEWIIRHVGEDHDALCLRIDFLERFPGRGVWRIGLKQEVEIARNRSA